MEGRGAGDSRWAGAEGGLGVVAGSGGWLTVREVLMDAAVALRVSGRVALGAGRVLALSVEVVETLEVGSWSPGSVVILGHFRVPPLPALRLVTLGA